MLEEERCELEQLGDINSALIIKERQSTYELQEAHTELIKGNNLYIHDLFSLKKDLFSFSLVLVI